MSVLWLGSRNGFHHYTESRDNLTIISEQFNLIFQKIKFTKTNIDKFDEDATTVNIMVDTATDFFNQQCLSGIDDAVEEYI